MKQDLFPNTVYLFLLSLLGLVYITGLFVPLMDNDSAHHANIALRMHLTGDYISLIDAGNDYLDKPHLHFWLSALSYKLFGVTGFAYKFPSFLFTILGTWSTFQLGKLLYDSATGKLAALITASSFGYMLANNDVRMDAVLTACIIFSSWQLVAFVQNKKLLSVLLAALGLAAGFSVKGHIGVILPGVGLLFYLLYLRKWKELLHWKWLLLATLFLLFISPVVYCYYLQYNLHPEKVVRGRDHINGIRFILIGQSIERFQGDNFGGASKKDYLFFLHTFLWAFSPWSLLAYMAVVQKIKTFRQRKEEWLTTGTFLVLLLIISFSGFKLPHYLNVVFPFTGILVATMLLGNASKTSWVRSVFKLQAVVVVLLLLLSLVLNGWAFPVRSSGLVVVIILLLSVPIYFVKSSLLNPLQKTVGMSASAMVLVFFCLNSNFYPQLLPYQGGKELADIAGKRRLTEVYCWDSVSSSSYSFYSRQLRKPFSDTLLYKGEKIWLLYKQKQEKDLLAKGYTLEEKHAVPCYHITKLTLKFLNPQTRMAECDTIKIANISR